jgi:short subunit dehydrogenase-like uncharacterized protein
MTRVDDGRNDRPYDIVVFGATGFTTGLAADYLAEHAPPELRWALAGRDERKLDAVRTRLSRIDPRCAELALLRADVADPASLRALAEQTRVLMNGVGPYLHFGEPVVAACSDAGTDYLDLTGEPEFVDKTYVRHHRRAAQTGARLVHACGLDCAPTDLGVWFTVRQLPVGQPIRIDGVVRVGGQLVPSGGTWGTALEIMSRPGELVRSRRARAALEVRPSGRTVRTPVGAPRREGDSLLVPLPTLELNVVAYSARSSERYGADFRYRHYLGLPKLWMAPVGLVGVTALGLAAQIPPARRWLQSRQPSGAGPSPEQRANSWFTVSFRGESAGTVVRTEVSGGDPAYGETSKMFAESALCLALDDLPDTRGQVTTAVAMGDALIDRFAKAGISFRTVG